MYKLIFACWNLLRFCWRIIKAPTQAFTIFLRTIWLIFPAAFFVLAVFTCFWQLSQGKDVLISMLEKKLVGGIVLLALIFWVLVTWYSSRIIIYRKKQLYADNKRYEQIVFHTPRLLGFIGFSLIWIALLKLPRLPHLNFLFRLHKGMDVLWLVITILAYFALYKWFKFIRDKKLMTIDQLAAQPDAINADQLARLKLKFRQLYLFIGCVVAGLLILNTIFANAWLLLSSIVLLQIIYLFVVVSRRGPGFAQAANGFYQMKMPQDHGTIKDWQQAEDQKGNHFVLGLWERLLYNANIPAQEKPFFIIFNIIGLLSLTVYFITIFNYQFSVMLGSFATVLLAFGILVGFFGMISFISVALRINLHVIGFIAILIFGKVTESHNVTLINTPKATQQVFANRPDLKTYFTNWAAKRRADIEKGAYPMFFVLADGGASRSGYWTAATLSKLEDTTQGKFSQHLFCLSGASGGSVGNGTFFALLQQKDSLRKIGRTYTDGACDFLQSDFLTYTLARMLGPDFVRPLLGSLPVADRAAALEQAIEQGGEAGTLLYSVFKKPLSECIPTPQNDLPILCINVTRMQDGRPSVISNIKADAPIFNQRVDILKRLPAGKDMKLSTAVVMGARFPYISPAGRIDSSYYVDGGYFDNSGGGFVHEMIIELRKIIDDSVQANPQHYYKNLQFCVVHSQNGGTGEKLLQKIHPIWNDLGSPILTMLGAFGTQTSVNDSRLKNYMQDTYRGKNQVGYFSINLYTHKKNEEEYPMNWAISQYYIQKMNALLVDPGNDMAFFYNYMKRRGVF
jgi:predicted acylesterase/phospholipase RssA